jgi:ribosome biogenesis protein Nip4
LGLSACEFFLLTGLYKNERFCYLNHLQEELGKCFDEFSNYFIFNLNDLHLIVGGGQVKENDILRQLIPYWLQKILKHWIN